MSYRISLVAPFLVSILLLGACSMPARSGETAPDGLVWVARTYSLGQQCTGEQVSAPSPAQALAEAGVRVRAEHIEPMMVCAACTCPAYAAVHYARIAAGDVAAAQAAGFEPSEAPADR